MQIYKHTQIYKDTQIYKHTQISDPLLAYSQRHTLSLLHTHIHHVQISLKRQVHTPDVVLQCVSGAVCCSVQQCAAVWYSVLQCAARATCCRALQCFAVFCSVLQCVAVCCSVLQCVAVCCSVLQCVAVCCSILGNDAKRYKQGFYTHRIRYNTRYE